MKLQRKLVNTYTPPAEQGFLGPEHTARAVILNEFTHSDPFILLMDDYLDKKTTDPVGGAHPHAGFETVTLVLEGGIGDDTHRLEAGDFEIMTAGSGIVHTETISEPARMRILQLWLTLPRAHRWAQPRLQTLRLGHAPALSSNGVHIQLYSGTLAGLSSPVLNHVPLIAAVIVLEPGVDTVLQLPATFNTFLYGIEGSVLVGEEGKPLVKNQVGWLDLHREDSSSELKLRAGDTGARLVLYAGQPQGDKIVPYGPFIGDSIDDIRRLYQDYREHKMEHIASVPKEQRITW